MSTKKTLIISTSILLFAAVVTTLVFMTEPTAKSEGATKKMAMLVEVIPAEKGNFEPVFIATGTVSPVEDVTLSPLVSGQIIRRAPAFTPGGYVEEGTVLLQIDPSDYRNELELKKSDLLQARTDLDMEMGRQEVAEKDLALIGGDSLSPQERSLVLRKPQLNAVKANIAAAEAAVEQAKLNLARTTIRAPFDAHILTQNVTEGSQVAPGDNLGRLVGSDFYWVSLTVPLTQLQWLRFPATEEEQGSEVKMRNTSAWPKGVFRSGYLSKQVGALDEQTRLARVLVKVPQPLARQQDKPELIIGSFVEARLLGEQINDVVRLKRDYLHNNDEVWTMEDGKLSINKVEVQLKDSEYAYISSGLEDGAKVVTTNLSTVTEGIPLRTQRDTTASEENKQQPVNN
ncbi:efflux RND transporter periplasmic adaptor subunit [Salinimicrobium catena]|uniref:efflux RND transporter periplasmic adaptor subunit n=1 Tax=Salinimicrobium catena TaxID=390640 RepID=UPI002FE4CA26